MTARVTDTDHGMRALLQRLEQRATVSVGVLHPEAPHGSSTVGAVAEAVEFGAPARGLTQRSFVRAAVDQTRPAIEQGATAAARRVIEGRGALEADVEATGERLAAAMRARVPVATGQLRDAIGVEAVG